MNRMKITQFLFVFFSILFLASNSYGGSCVVSNDDGLLSVKATDSKLQQIFSEIAMKFNVYIKIFPEMKSRKISADILKVPLKEGVKKLVKANYAIVERGNRIEKIFILNRGKNFQTRNGLMDKFISRQFLELPDLVKVVTNNIRKQCPKAQLFTLIPHEDIRGNLKSYAFCFYLGDGMNPSKEEIEKQVQEAWEGKKEARIHIREGYRTNDSSEVVEWLEKSRPYDHMLRRNEEFITLEISASYDSPPIKSFYMGIPYDIAMYPNAVEILEDNIGKEKTYKFKRTFRLNLLAIGFEFQGKDENSYYIDVLNKSVFTGWKKRTPKKRKTFNRKRKERIGEQWLEFLGT